MITRFAFPLLIAFAAPIGCTGDTFHEKFDWRAEDYFEDPQVIVLCHAIEASDLPPAHGRAPSTDA